MDQYLPGGAFVTRIRAEALASPAVRHPYLQAISAGGFTNMDEAFRDFACHYGFYSAGFSRYVAAVIEQLTNPLHREILQSNLAEEQGDTHDVDLPAEVLSSVTGQPHSRLFQRFQAALGVDAAYREQAQFCQQSVLWGEQFLALCRMNEYVGVGAIGLGTEIIVPEIYAQILAGLEHHSCLSMTQRVFFDLHSQCDEIHARQLLLISEELACDQHACEQIAFGARSAIRLRVAFWDQMLARAAKIDSAVVTEGVSALEY